MSKKKTRRKRARARALAGANPVKTADALCPLCRNPAHEGNSEETLASLAALNPEAAVFFDRDLAELADVVGLCGPRFRQFGRDLNAHYGSPYSASGYLVYRWNPDDQKWSKFVDSRYQKPVCGNNGGISTNDAPVTCVLPKGHPGPHEAPLKGATVRWGLADSASLEPTLVSEESNIEEARRRWLAGFRTRVEAMERLIGPVPEDAVPTPSVDGDD